MKNINIKEIFNNVRTKVNESKIATVVNNVVSKITNNNFAQSVKTKVSGLKSSAKNYTNNTQSVKESMSNNVSSRFSEKIKRFFKNNVKNIQTKSNNGSKFAKFTAGLIKVLSIVATIAFSALVIYCIKDVFIQCLLFVATCAAVTISIEFILSVLSIATGCKI